MSALTCKRENCWNDVINLHYQRPTTPWRGFPCLASTKDCAISRATFTCASAVLAPRWGVATTSSCSTSSLKEHKTWHGTHHNCTSIPYSRYTNKWKAPGKCITLTQYYMKGLERPILLITIKIKSTKVQTLGAIPGCAVRARANEMLAHALIKCTCNGGIRNIARRLRVTAKNCRESRWKRK